MKNLASFLLILTLFNCSVQKRHHLPGWDINWNFNKLQKETISKSSDTIKIAFVESSTSSIPEHFTIATKQSFIALESAEEKANFSADHNFAIKKRPLKSYNVIKNRTSKIVKKVDTSGAKNKKVIVNVFFILGVIALIFGLYVAYLLPTSTAVTLSFYSLLALLLFILGLVFMKIALKNHRELKNKNDSNNEKQYPEIEEENRKTKNENLKAVGITGWWRFWFVMAAIIAVVAFVCLFTLEYGAFLAIPLIIPFIALLILGLIRWIIYRKRVKQFENNEYVPKMTRRYKRYLKRHSVIEKTY